MLEPEPKIPNVLELIRERANSGDFVVLPHATTRREERNISVADIIFVLKHGEHESDLVPGIMQ